MIATVQAFVLIELLFELDKEDGRDVLSPSNEKRNSALLNALTFIIWNSGSNKSAKLVLYVLSKNSFVTLFSNGSATFNKNKLNHSEFEVLEFSSKEKLREAIQSHFTQVLL